MLHNTPHSDAYKRLRLSPHIVSRCLAIGGSGGGGGGCGGGGGGGGGGK